MAKRKRTSAQKLVDFIEIETLALQGKGQREIANILSKSRDYTLSRQQIQYDISKLEKMWQEESKAEIDAEKGRALAEVRNLQAVYWAAWEASRGEVKTITRKGIAGKAQTAKQGTKAEPAISRQEVTEHIEQAVGDPRFLKGIEWCIEQRCVILGTKAPTRDLAAILNIDVTKLTTEQLQRISAGKEDLVSVITNPSTSRA
jgi:hypothetical protein